MFVAVGATAAALAWLAIVAGGVCLVLGSSDEVVLVWEEPPTAGR